MSSVLDRSDIDDAYKWSIESMYDDESTWEADFERVERLIDELEGLEGRVDESGETLLEILETREKLFRTLETVARYAGMRRDEDTRREVYQAMASRSQSLVARARSASSYIEPELQQLQSERLARWLEAHEALQVYEHYLDDVMRHRAHTRSAEVEEVLAELSDVLGAPGTIFSMFQNADLEFPAVGDPSGETVELTESNFVTLLKRPDRDFRRAVYETYYDRWAAYRNTVATTYRYVLERERTIADTRGHEDARAMNLFGPNVPETVYDTLVGTVTENLDVLHDHVDLKRRVLGVDEVRMWDLYAPLGPEEDPTIEYEEATEYVIDALGALGEEYQRRVSEGIEGGWIDVYENRGKRSGAYSGGTYDSQPFILMNYQDDIASMYTLAHELGHSLHSQYTSEAQPYIYSHYTTFLAEVASTVNEVLLTHHLLETLDDPDIRRAILDQSIERYRTVLYRQTMFADFEQRAHELVEEGDGVTADRLDELYRDRKVAFYEPAEVDDHIAREWMRVPHFYRPFYVFQYSTGISTAIAIARRIVNEGQPAADRYLDFLRLGSSDYPLELLDEAGVDLRDSTPIEAAIDVYADRIERFEETIDGE